MKEKWEYVQTDMDYQISSLGRIMHDGKIVEHDNVTIYIGGKVMRISHLVLEAFVGPRPGRADCVYKDGNRWNNSLDNLEWVKQSRRKKLTTVQARRIKKAYEENRKSIKQLAGQYNVSTSTIYKIVKGHYYENIH